MNMINWLEKWKNQFPEDVCRIKIQTLDNPGWIVEINLENTGFEIKEFEKVSFDNSDDDWIVCEIKNKTFTGVGDPYKLEDIIDIFKSWIENKEVYVKCKNNIKRIEPIDYLQNWYNDQCDGYWEHIFEIKIYDCKNFIWVVEIDITDTYLEDKPFKKIDMNNGKNDWIICNVEDNGTHSKDKDDDTDLYKLYGLKWPNRKYNDCNVFIEHKKFIGKGDQFKLEMILKIFKNWAETGEY